MKQSILSGALSGAVAAAVVLLVAKPGPAPTQGTEPSAAGPTAASPEAGRIDALGEQVARLENELSMLEGVLGELRGMGAGQLAVRAPIESDLAGLAPEDVERLKELASAAQNGDLGAGADYLAVRSTLEQIREEEEAEDAARRRERDLERVERDLERLTEDLGLVGYQVDGMRDIMTNELDQRAALFAETRESGDWTQMRDSMREIRDGVNSAAEELLGPDLFEQYESTQGRGRGGFGGFGGGGGGGGTAGGGRGGGGGNF